ncbi:MAG: hypothetical protein NZ693_09845 [Thermoflexales bacterium]|nr:hypothetical protein [Thermoflexales bacterium]
MSKPCVFRMSDGRPVGRIVGRTFVRRAPFSRAIVRRLNALALHADLARALQARGVVEVVFEDTESNRRLVAPLSEFFGERAVLFNFGLGDQLALPMRLWREVSPVELSPLGRGAR